MPKTGQCHLLTLPDELIVEILSYCPVETTLKLESACKRLYRICRSNSVWKTHLQNLDVTQAPSLYPFDMVDSHSEPELRGKTSNAVQRYRAWNMPGEMPPVRALELLLPHIEEERIMKMRLLPGGREILIANHGSVELWNIETGQQLWIIAPPVGHIDTVGFDFDIIDDGNVLAVAVVCKDGMFQNMSLVRVYNYNFTSRALDLILERRLPTISPSRVNLQSDFFVCAIPRLFQSILINWRSGDALVLDFGSPTGDRCDARSKLIAGNMLIVLVQEAETGLCAVQVPLSALREYWSDQVDHNAWQRIPFRPSEQGYSVLPLPYISSPDDEQNGTTGYGPWILAQHVFTPSWRRNAPTEIFIVAYTVNPGATRPMHLISFRLQLSHSRGSGSEDDRGTLRLVKSSSAPIDRLPRNPRNISNAALMFSLRQNLQVFSLFSEDEQPISEIVVDPDVIPVHTEFDPNISSVDPWSGTIAVRFPGGVKVLYFD